MPLFIALLSALLRPLNYSRDSRDEKKNDCLQSHSTRYSFYGKSRSAWRERRCGELVRQRNTRYSLDRYTLTPHWQHMPMKSGFLNILCSVESDQNFERRFPDRIWFSRVWRKNWKERRWRRDKEDEIVDTRMYLAQRARMPAGAKDGLEAGLEGVEFRERTNWIRKTEGKTATRQRDRNAKGGKTKRKNGFNEMRRSLLRSVTGSAMETRRGARYTGSRNV